MDVFLETERLILRRFTEADLDDLVELNSDPEVMRFLTGGKPSPRAFIETRTLPRILRQYDPPNGFGTWAAIERSSGEFLGWFHFRPPKDGPPDEAELGYRLRQSAWGMGYATEASRALIRKGFTEQGVQRVVAYTYGENRRSRRVMEKAGLTMVRAYRLSPAELTELLEEETFDGGDLEIWDGDDVEYALTREDWERQEARAGSGRVQ
jgi:RimJ/RimL family protein N-acetyltransferase